MKEKIIKYGDLEFKLLLTEDNQVAFYFKIPPELSEWKNDPLFYSWDPDDDIAYGDEWSTSFEGLPSDVSIFRIKSFLVKEIVNFIHQNHLTWFWFQPTSDQRERIYHLFVNSFVRILNSKMSSNWKYQKIDDYFYFNE